MPEENQRVETPEEEYARLQQDPRVDSSSELILAITKPVVRKKYAPFISRDLAVGNIPKKRPELLDWLRRCASLMNDFIFLDTKDFPTMEMADVYNADMKVLLNLLRSIDGFERKQQTTITSRREGGFGVPAAAKLNRWGLKKR